MSRYDGGWAPYVPAAERRRQAERAIAKLRRTGHPVAPVLIDGRLIATTFWGRAWCDNMESYRDYESRLPRGRTYVRNGSVVDLQIAPGRIAAMVNGSDLYHVTITVREAATAHWRAICADCAGSIDSLVELLQGRLSKSVMERLCRQGGGLFPRPSEIRFSCSCPDHALMCKHVAAVLYGVGARLDQTPDLLFRLRAVDETELVAGINAALPQSNTGPAAGKILETDDIAALFGLDMAAPELPATGQLAGRNTTARADRISQAPAGAASAASAAGRSTAAPTPGPGESVPATPAPARTPAAAKKGPVRPVIPSRRSAASQATATKPSGPQPGMKAKASPRPVVQEKGPAIMLAEAPRQVTARPPDSDDVQRRAKARPVGVLDSGRRKRPPSGDKAVTVRRPDQKPVKWW